MKKAGKKPAAWLGSLVHSNRKGTMGDGCSDGLRKRISDLSRFPSGVRLVIRDMRNGVQRLEFHEFLFGGDVEAGGKMPGCFALPSPIEDGLLDMIHEALSGYCFPEVMSGGLCVCARVLSDDSIEVVAAFSA